MFDTEKYAEGGRQIGDLFELNLIDAAQIIHSSLEDPSQTTIDDIDKGLVDAVRIGDIKLKRGSIVLIGQSTKNPPIFDAFDIADWAERNGLTFDRDSNWLEYIYQESDIHEALLERLGALRALQQAGKKREELISPTSEMSETEQDQLIKLTVENSQLRDQLNSADPNIKLPAENPKSIASLLKMVWAMAVDGYGYRATDKKSPVPKEIADALDKLGEKIDSDTTRHWLQVAAEKFR